MKGSHNETGAESPFNGNIRKYKEKAFIIIYFYMFLRILEATLCTFYHYQPLVS